MNGGLVSGQTSNHARYPEANLQNEVRDSVKLSDNGIFSTAVP